MIGARKIRKPTGEAKLKRAWAEHKVEALARMAPAQPLLPLTLGLFAGTRQGDALRVPRSAYKGQTLRWSASKNDEPCSAPVTELLRTVLEAAREEARRARAETEASGLRRPLPLQIALTRRGTSCTESGCGASFFKLLAQLERQGRPRRWLHLPRATAHDHGVCA